MSSADSSTSLRAHIDDALPPIYEQLFAALDLLLTLRAGPRPDTARASVLRAALDARLVELDHPDSEEPDGRPSSERTTEITLWSTR